MTSLNHAMEHLGSLCLRLLSALALLNFSHIPLQAPELCYPASCPTLVNNLHNIHRAMRRPGLLQRADELIPHSIGRVLLSMAANMQGHPDNLM